MQSYTTTTTAAAAATAAPSFYTPAELLESFPPFPPQGDFRPTFYNPFEIKHRRRTSRAQLKVLEKSFAENAKPNAAVRRMLAQKLDMTPRGVQIWFQNRRAKAKLQRRKAAASQQQQDSSASSSTTQHNASNNNNNSTATITSPAEQQQQQQASSFNDASHHNNNTNMEQSVLFSQFSANIGPACMEYEGKPAFATSIPPNATVADKSATHYWPTTSSSWPSNTESAQSVALAAAAAAVNASTPYDPSWFVHPLQDDMTMAAARRNSCPVPNMYDPYFEVDQCKDRRVSETDINSYNMMPNACWSDPSVIPVDFCTMDISFDYGNPAMAPSTCSGSSTSNSVTDSPASLGCFDCLSSETFLPPAFHDTA